MPFEINNKFINKTLLEYIPHGINKNTFHPLDDNDILLNKRKKEVFKGGEYNFILLFNSRNVQRKRPSNILLAYRVFCDNLSKEEAAKCLLVLHTEIRQDAGTDLLAVKESFCPDYNVMFSENKYTPEDMNVLYNIADITICMSTNEGFGISTAESLMAGTPIIAPVTGGVQDQIGQTKDDGSEIEFDGKFASNNCGKYKKHGIWAYALFPQVLCIQGSPQTPQIFDDMNRYQDAADGMMYWYLLGKEKRKEYGQKGREWMLNEGGLNSENMCKKFVEAMTFTIKHFKPVKSFGIFTEKDYIGNLMADGNIGVEIPVIDKEEIRKQIKNKEETGYIKT